MALVTSKLKTLSALVETIQKSLETYTEEQRKESNIEKSTVLKGEELRASRKYEEAVKVYSSVLTTPEKADKMLFVKAYSYSEMKDYGKAIEEYGKAIELNKNNPGYLNNRGLAYKDSG